MTSTIEQHRALADRATAHLIQKYTPAGNRVGWMMIASIFVEAWDLYAISFLLVFLNAQYHPSPLLLGLASARAVRRHRASAPPACRLNDGPAR